MDSCWNFFFPTCYACIIRLVVNSVCAFAYSKYSLLVVRKSASKKLCAGAIQSDIIVVVVVVVVVVKLLFFVMYFFCRIRTSELFVPCELVSSGVVI